MARPFDDSGGSSSTSGILGALHPFEERHIGLVNYARVLHRAPEVGRVEVDLGVPGVIPLGEHDDLSPVVRSGVQLGALTTVLAAAGRIVNEAMNHLPPDDWETANELLQRKFAEKNICARDIPRYEVAPEYGMATHYAHCHLTCGEGRGPPTADHTSGRITVE